MGVSFLRPWELSASDLGQSIDKEASRVTKLAHQPDRWLRPHDGEAPPQDQRFSVKLPRWQSRIRYAYSVDIIPHQVEVIIERGHEPAAAPTGREEVWRHLSIQLSVPDQVSQAQLNADGATLLALYQPQVQAFFPLQSAIRTYWQVSTPIPVVHPDRSAQGQRSQAVTFRTVITANFLVPWNGGVDPYIRDIEGT